MKDLVNKHCLPCEGGVPALSIKQAQAHLQKLSKWQLNSEGIAISKYFKFNDFKSTMLFVNALAWLAEDEGHHPDLQVGYGYCEVTFTTHAINGLSENDFICAHKIEQIFNQNSTAAD